MGGGTWTPRRRRAEPDREGQKLRLATRLLREELQRGADSQSRHAARLGEACPLLGTGDRAGQPHVLPRYQNFSADKATAVPLRKSDGTAQAHELRRRGRR